jgi:hypothetical protein
MYFFIWRVGSNPTDRGTAMKLLVPYEKISSAIPLALIDGIRDLITEADWYAYDYRKPMFPSSSNSIYESIIIRHSSEYSTSTIRDMPLYSKYIHALTPILDFIKQFYRVDEYVAFLARLGSGGKIDTHRDSGEFLETVHRLHIAIETNTKCFYIVEGTHIHMPVGTIYEIDNQREHGVTNKGSTARIHLVVNVYGSRIKQIESIK